MSINSTDGMAKCVAAGLILGAFVALQVRALGGERGQGPSASRTNSKRAGVLPSISFLIENDHGTPVSGAQVSLGNGSRPSHLETDRNGRCSVSSRDFAPGAEIPFRITADGFEMETGRVGPAEIRARHVLVLAQLRPSISSQATPAPAAVTPQQAGPSAAAPPSSEESSQASSQSNWVKRQPTALLMAIVLAILIAAIGGAAVWTQHIVNRSLREQGSYVEKAMATMDNRTLGGEPYRLTKAIFDQQGKLSKTLASIEQGLNELLERGQAQAQSSTQPEPRAAAAAGLSFGLAREDETEKFPENEIDAQNAYRLFLRNRSLFSQAIYANRETASSPINMLQEGPASLVEVDHRQGSFILFRDRKGVRAWAFPNPDLIFRKEVFGRLFPKLDSSTFERSKESIGPVELSSAGERRWKVVLQ